jgi:hypothetical protein
LKKKFFLNLKIFSKLQSPLCLAPGQNPILSISLLIDKAEGDYFAAKQRDGLKSEMDEWQKQSGCI